MRVDASQILAAGGVKLKADTGLVSDSVKEGDEANGGAADDDLSLGEKSLVRGFSDKSLAPYAAKLAELNMPVTEESARAMRDVMAQNPKMSMDEAAFLASNKLTGDDSLMKAALDVLSGGDKTDAMISKLLLSLNADASTDLKPGFQSVNAQNTAPLTQLITFIVKNATTPLTIITHPEGNMQLNVSNTEEFFTRTVENELTNTQTAQNMQNSDTVLTQNNQQTQSGQLQEQTPQAMPAPEQAVPATGQPQEQAAEPQQSTQVTGQPQDTQQPVVSQQPQDTQQPVISKQPQVPAPQTGADELKQPAHAHPDAHTQQDGQPQQSGLSTGSAVAGLLSEIPEFKGTPHSALERFSNMLLRVANDNAAASDASEDTKMLAAQLDKMFTKISRNDADAGQRLREAREELFARLSLIEEEISRATGPAKAELLTQTQKLMDHVKLLNNIDQFLYMQLPVQLNEQKKAAELYIFKRKGGKRSDPDNVNILLAIDLEFMGHWEALLNIKGKDVQINMEVQSEKEKDHFNENTVLLHDMLSDEGFKLVGTNIKISKEETTPLTALLAFNRYTGGHQGKIDFFH